MIVNSESVCVNNQEKLKRLNLKNKSLWIKTLSPPALNAYSCTYVDTHNQDLRAWHLTVERVFLKITFYDKGVMCFSKNIIGNKKKFHIFFIKR